MIDDVSARLNDKITAFEEIKRLLDVNLDKKFELENKIDGVKESMSSYELNAREAVLGALDSEGKPVFKNEAQREIGVVRRLDENGYYQELRSELKSLEKELGLVRVRLDKASKFLSICKVQLEGLVSLHNAVRRSD